MRKSRIVSVGITGVLVLGVASAASARPPWERTSDEYIMADTTTIADAAGNIVTSDGVGPYSLSEVRTAYVHDFRPSVGDIEDATQTQDVLYFSTDFDGARFSYFNDTFASAAAFGPGSTEPIRCRSNYLYFESASTPDWYEQVQAGDEVNGWGAMGCYTYETGGYYAFYRAEPLGPLAGECLKARLSGEDTVIVEAPSDSLPGTGCIADIYSFDNAGGTWQFETLGVSVAPFQFALDLATGIEPPDDKPGNGNGKGPKH